jgi:hypothetical protein
LETHAHHIHKAPGKGWKHYFFEFLMLFLAVFAGFLAENQREHISEKNKEKQYLKSLWLDLQQDTATLRSDSSEIVESSKRIYTLIRLLKSSDRNNFACEIYKLAITIPFSIAGRAPQPNRKTFEQLKSSGNLRLILNNELLDRIGVYYQGYDQLMAGGPGQMLFQNKHDLYLFTYELFDMTVFSRMLQAHDKPSVNMFDKDSCIEKPVILSNDPMVINKICSRYYYMVMTERAVLAQAWIPRFLSEAEWLLKELQREYHFKN